MQLSTFWFGAVGKSGVKIKESLRRSVPCKREIGASVAANKAFQPTRLRRAVERGVSCVSSSFMNTRQLSCNYQVFWFSDIGQFSNIIRHFGAAPAPAPCRLVQCNIQQPSLSLHFGSVKLAVRFSAFFLWCHASTNTVPHGFVQIISN